MLNEFPTPLKELLLKDDPDHWKLSNFPLIFNLLPTLDSINSMKRSLFKYELVRTKIRKRKNTPKINVLNNVKSVILRNFIFFFLFLFAFNVSSLFYNRYDFSINYLHLT